MDDTNNTIAPWTFIVKMNITWFGSGIYGYTELRLSEWFNIDTDEYLQQRAVWEWFNECSTWIS